MNRGITNKLGILGRNRVLSIVAVLGIITGTLLLANYIKTKPYTLKLLVAPVNSAYLYETRKNEFYTASFGSKSDPTAAPTQFGIGEKSLTFTPDSRITEVKKEGDTKVVYIADNGIQFIQTLKKEGLKEDIVIDGSIDKIVYSVDLEGIKYKKVNDEWHFYDEDGKDVFYIPKPFMVDSNGRRSDDVKLWLADDKLNVVPNQDWLESSDTVYPVTIDPSLIITILTVHSHPQQGDDWIVEFETQGLADLRIIPDDQATIDDDEFTGLYCGDEEIIPQILNNDIIYVENWECEETAKVIHFTKKAGTHTLRFEFGGQVAYAYNLQSTYTFVGVTQASNDYYAYEKYGVAAFTNQDDTGNSEATNTDYDNISSTNDVRWETVGATSGGEYDSQLYKFYIDESEATVSQLDFKWEGYGETQANYDTTFYAWDYDISDWVQLANVDFTSATDQNLTFPESTDPGKFVDSDGEVTLMVKSKKFVIEYATCDSCSCNSSDYETLICSGDTVYVDCNADKCWTPTQSDTYNWSNAISKCSGLNYGGKTDWVVPDITTLENLCNSGSCSGTCFSGDGEPYWYWSSTESSSNAYCVRFNSCWMITYSKAGIRYVRCVR